MNDSSDPSDAAERCDPDALVDALAAELEVELAVEAAKKPRKKRWWTLPARLAISAAMLWFLVKKIADVSFSDLVPVWTATTFAWLGVALGLTLLSVVLSAARWQQVLDGLDVPSRFRRLLSN